MEILKELKKEARKIRKAKSEPVSLELRLHEYSRSGSIAALTQIHHYLHEFIEQVYLACPDIAFDYELPSVGTLENCSLEDYLLSYESTLKDNAVRLSVSIPCQQGRLDEQPDNKKLEEYQQAGISVKLEKDRLTLHKSIPSTLIFKTTNKGTDISMQMIHLDKPGKSSWQLSPAHIDNHFLDELGRFLLHKPNTLMELIAEKPKTMNKKSEDPKDTEMHTQEMDVSRFQSLFNKDMRLYLTYQNDIRELTSKSSEFILGRSSSCHMIIDSDLASRQHAILIYRKGKFILKDQSTNGTFIKSEGGKEMFLQGEEAPISGSGFISLGKSVTVDNEHLVYFSCQ